jgi:arylsulfatase A-like enzyme/Flp pilus assembly protein TadD
VRAGAPLLLAALLASGCSRSPTGPPTSVLLVTIDTLRADRVGAFGGPPELTPHLDRLASKGARFEAAWAASPLTLPSHASLMTGLWPPRHGLRDNGQGALPSAVPTLAQALSLGGRRSAAFVGAFVLDRRFGLDRGFASYDDEIPKGPGARTGIDAERPGRVVVDRALAWLEASGPSPFFLWVHLYDPHAPYDPPAPFRERFPGRPYDGEVAAADAEVGRLLEALERRGLASSTVVAVAADHGEALGDHGEPTHGLLLYEPTLRVPMIVRAPGVAPGTRVGAPVSLVDLGPTVAGLAGTAWPAGESPRDGRDLSRELRAGREPEGADLYAETEYPRVFGWSPLAAVRRGPHKYIQAPRPELYRLDSDPGERRDLLAGERRLAAELSGRTREIREAARSAAPAAGDPAETLARLASLGYLGGASVAPSAGRDPKEVVALFARLERAREDLEAGRLQVAADELGRLVAEDPGNPVFRGTLAEAHRRLGESGLALEQAGRALAAAPSDPQGWLRLARALESAGGDDRARAAYLELLRLDPRQADGWNSLGVLEARGGRAEAARAAFARALESDPAHATAANNLGNALRMLGRPDEAAAAYRRAIALVPSYPDPWNGLAVLEIAAGNPEAALPDLERALALAPMQHENLLNRAIAFQMLGDRRRASADLEQFLRRTQGDPSYSASRAAALRMRAGLGGAD